MAKDPYPELDIERYTELAAEEIDTKGMPKIGKTRHERKIVRQRLAWLDRETNAADAIQRIPAKGHEVFLIMTGKFHGFDILGGILDLAGEGVTIDDLKIATLGFNRDQTDRLAEMIDAGQIKRVVFVVSNLFSEKNGDEYDYLSETLTARGQVVANTRNHTKIILIALSDGRRLVVHGSLNLRRCNNFEQVAISNDPQTFDFLAAFIHDAATGTIQA